MCPQVGIEAGQAQIVAKELLAALETDASLESKAKAAQGAAEAAEEAAAVAMKAAEVAVKEEMQAQAVVKVRRARLYACMYACAFCMARRRRHATWILAVGEEVQVQAVV